MKEGKGIWLFIIYLNPSSDAFIGLCSSIYNSSFKIAKSVYLGKKIPDKHRLLLSSLQKEEDKLELLPCSFFLRRSDLYKKCIFSSRSNQVGEGEAQEIGFRAQKKPSKRCNRSHESIITKTSTTIPTCHLLEMVHLQMLSHLLVGIGYSDVTIENFNQFFKYVIYLCTMILDSRTVINKLISGQLTT